MELPQSLTVKYFDDTLSRFDESEGQMYEIVVATTPPCDRPYHHAA